MPKCKQCGMVWNFDYSSDLCGPWCDGAYSQRAKIEKAYDEIKSKTLDCSLLQAQLDRVFDLIDDILFDPHFQPVNDKGEPLRGKDRYLVNHPVVDKHVPALRQWFADAMTRDTW